MQYPNNSKSFTNPVTIDFDDHFYKSPLSIVSLTTSIYNSNLLYIFGKIATLPIL